MSKGSLRAELKELGERENWSRPVSPLFCLRVPTSPLRTSHPDERQADPLPYANSRMSGTHYRPISSVQRPTGVCGGIQMLRELIAKSNLEIVGAAARIGPSNLSGPYLRSGP